MGDPILDSNITRRVDFALFMVASIENDELVQEAAAIVGRRTPSTLAHTNLGLVYKSEDGGETWRQLKRQFGEIRAMILRPLGD